jgi:DNA-binding SARP family transcriptional activator
VISANEVALQDIKVEGRHSVIRLHTLGQIELPVGEDGDVNALLSQPKRLALLCYLAIPKPGTMFRRDTLLGVFWPEDSEYPRGALRQALSHIRKVLGPDVLVSRGSHEIGLNPDLFWCDVAAFEQALDAGNRTEAVELYNGELLTGFYLSNTPEWEHWLDGQRARLTRRFAETLEQLAIAASDSGDTQAAVRWWQKLVAYDEYDSRYAMSLMEALERSGDPANALIHGRRHKDYLLANLDIVPTPEFGTLMERMHAEHGPDFGTSVDERPDRDRRARQDRRVRVEEESGPQPNEQSVEVSEPPAIESDSKQLTMGRVWMLAGITAIVAIVIALAGSALMIRREPGVRLNQDHVVVAAFRNATGDPSLDVLGERTAHWITQGLQYASVPVTPWEVALQAWQSVREEADVGEVRNFIKALGEETGAGTVISGAIYLDGDELEIQVDVSDAWRGRLIGSPPPMFGKREFQRELIGEVQQQVMVFLAAIFDERLEGLSPDLVSRAPSFDAYQEFVRGFERHTARDYEAAIAHYKMAIELDSTWAQPAIRMKAAAFEADSPADREYVMVILEGLGDRLSQYEQAVVESFRAQDNGEREALLAALRREVELAPGSPSVNNLAIHLNRQNLPREGLQVMLSVDLERGWWRRWAPRWDLVADSYHMLGEYEQELSTAQRCSELHPDYDRCQEFRSRALAALGRAEQLNRLMDEVESQDKMSSMQGAILPAIATLKANGFDEASQNLAMRMNGWLEDRPEGEKRSVEFQECYAQTLFYAGRLVESMSVYGALVEESPERVDLRSSRAFVAALGGDAGQAAADYEWLELYDGSEWTENSVLWFQGVIAGALGRLEHAVDLLSQADRGYEAAFRIGMFYGPLRGYPPFQEWINPRG